MFFLLDNHTKIDKNHILKHNPLKFSQKFHPLNDKIKKSCRKGSFCTILIFFYNAK